ncbi:hypothetical protein GGQ86_003030 [Xanthobacter flavus]|uniref:DNA primase/polymerase bifunctional N-terminal domain-containing protein n=1 Tax=Xanthobacter flavus TaxID=281 RepID=A0A9W6CMG4_XANFL|nr:DUF3987 domain-containing protein [Xanthobacter flavus]MDR6334548.1 hypothetical protein [Xanthobacter flavus]GLI23434.1 hypothetical protein XFLAVUS301_31080 [Xanthobacter flavus]
MTINLVDILNDHAANLVKQKARQAAAAAGIEARFAAARSSPLPEAAVDEYGFAEPAGVPEDLAEAAPPARARQDTVSDQSATPMLDHALAAARRGIRVIPIPANSKAPDLPKWQEKATTDEAQIRRWAEEHPGCNWGGLTGCILDFDVKHRKRGAEMFDLFQMLFPGTYTQRSASGGYHMFFRPPEGAPPISNATGKLLAKFGKDCGIDVRGAAGQVVLAGSVVDGKAYEVVDDLPIAEAPEDLLALCGKERRKDGVGTAEGIFADHPADVARAVALLRDAEPAVEGQGGDQATYDLACEVRDRGVSESTALQLMLDHWNERCEPVWEVEDLATKVSNAYAHAKDYAGNKSVAADFGAPDPEAQERVEASEPPWGDWPEPEDLWADSRPPPRLPPGLLPSVLERWARDEALRMDDTDPGCFAGAALSTLSGIAPASLEVQVRQTNTGFKVRPILWCVLVGAPGARKTPTLKEAWKPVQGIQGRLDAANRKAREQHHAALSAMGKQKTGTLGAPRPERPRQSFVLIEDATTEAVARALAENGQGVACCVDELRGWLCGFDAYRANGKGKDAGFWLKGKDGSPHRVLRVGSDPIEVVSVAVSVCGGIQPEVLRGMYRDLGADGMLQRFLVFHVASPVSEHDLAPDLDAIARYRAVAEKLWELRGAGEFMPSFRFAPEADRFRREVVAFQQREIRAPDAPAGLCGWLDKLEGEWARIALMFHLIDWADGVESDALDLPLREIGPLNAERAFRFLTEYVFPHELFVHRCADGRRGPDSDAVWIAGYILSHESLEIRQREILRANASLKKLPLEAQARRVAIAMGELCEAGWARRAEAQNGSAPWTINPAVHQRFADIAVRERARRAHAREKISEAGAARRAIRDLTTGGT